MNSIINEINKTYMNWIKDEEIALQTVFKSQNRTLALQNRNP